jgi:hypothetical protein
VAFHGNFHPFANSAHSILDKKWGIDPSSIVSMRYSLRRLPFMLEYLNRSLNPDDHGMAAGTTLLEVGRLFLFCLPGRSH